jgi:catechol 2,3-dioxygenase-like lactoylglutathione lyase family enzyme
MAKIKSISGLLFCVKDLDDTKEFYEKLGFRFASETEGYLKGYINWFWVEFVPLDKVEPTLFQKIADIEDVKGKGAGLFIELNVDNVDEFYDELKSKGLKPSSEPRDWPWGRREFVLRDPDGYKLVFFQKK